MALVSKTAGGVRGAGNLARIRGFWFVSYGAIDRSEGDGLGVIVYITGRDEVHFDEWPVLKVDDESFPIVLRAGRRYIPAASAPHPRLGTATCWARIETADASDPWGVLTAAHVVSPDLMQIRVGDRVAMRGGSTGAVDLVGPPAIDAVVLAVDDQPADVEDDVERSLAVQNLIAPYIEVSVDGGVSGPVVTKVTHVTDTRGSLNPYLPIRVFLADPCAPGDSGALVADDADRGVGIYAAAMADAAGRPPEGVCQHLGQVQHCMNLVLKRP